MASKKYSLILVVLLLCMLSFSSKALARNIAADTSDLNSYEMGLSKRQLLGSDECKSNNRHPGRQGGDSTDNPRCHNVR
ncbi:hypothetical protein P8452_36042 [Trifolium repens]|nr:hypothetical protein P8452_36042 [Trifolium repens]